MTLSCQQKAGSKHILVVLKNGEPFKDIHVSIFGNRPKFDSIEELEEQEFQGARRYALKRLSMQVMLSATLRQQLKERKVDPAIIDKVIQECECNGYVNDQEWLESFIRGQKRKCVGPQMIRMKLREKGVDSTLIEEALEVDEVSQIKELLEGRFRNRDLSDYKEKQKVIAALQRRGYTLSTILNLILGK